MATRQPPLEIRVPRRNGDAALDRSDASKRNAPRERHRGGFAAVRVGLDAIQVARRRLEAEMPDAGMPAGSVEGSAAPVKHRSCRSG